MIGGKIGQEIIWFTHITCDKLTKSITALSVVMLHFFLEMTMYTLMLMP